MHKLWCAYPTVMSTTILELRLELGYSYKCASAARYQVCNWIFSHFRRLWCMFPSPSKWITISCGFSLSKHKLIAACLSLWSQDTNKESSQSKSATTFGWMDMSKRSAIKPYNEAPVRRHTGKIALHWPWKFGTHCVQHSRRDFMEFQEILAFPTDAPRVIII